uniref:Coagulation factor VII n=1 Tax=Denticeps clupeoides TaxID=299321 RepID=A0AAY4EWA7_9TELE
MQSANSGASEHFRIYFADRDRAHGVLWRGRRANSGWFEELKKGDLERECLEEKCSYEEAREVFEHPEVTNEFWKKYNVQDQCASSPCMNNATCSSLSGSYTCLCRPGFGGRDCEQGVVPQTCLFDNGQCEHFCREEGGQRHCSCADGYFLDADGEKCFTRGTMTPLHPDYLTFGAYSSSPPHATLPFPPASPLDPSQTSDAHLNPRARIVGGSECPKGHCPWQVQPRPPPLTLNWCVSGLFCHTGEHDRSASEGTEQTIEVDEIINHPDYVPATADNDIALLRLRRPIAFSNYAVPVCLPTRDVAERELWAIHYHTVSGWGRRSEGGPTATVLRHLKVPRIRTRECLESSNVSLTANMFCAGYIEGTEDSCKGDSGGPLVTRYRHTTFLLGIVSWGKGCAKPGNYGIYTRVSNYIPWVHHAFKIQYSTKLNNHITVERQTLVRLNNCFDYIWTL